jgi:hypothetical protein
MEPGCFQGVFHLVPLANQTLMLIRPIARAWNSGPNLRIFADVQARPVV